MQRLSPKIAYYLQMFRSGDAENAFHGLLELDRDILPELMAVFRSTQDIGLRELLVAVIWGYREQSVIPFLREALFDTEPRIWRQALNGLVSLASPAALAVLCEARTRQLFTQRETEEFRRWVEEAISQAETEIRRA
ncbi:MAG: hypothetical protein RIS76_964 [Verrucomicrobiota bacterium]|jgi:HEAT repeats